MIQRPKSLQEIPDHCSNFDEFGMSCRDFIGEWNHAPKPRGSMLAGEPRSLAQDFSEGVICDAFLAAMAEYFAEKEGVPCPRGHSHPLATCQKNGARNPLETCVSCFGKKLPPRS